MTSVRIATALAVLVIGMPLLPLLAQDGAAPPAPQPPAGMMMESCEYHQAMTSALSTMARTVADTKTSKAVTKLRAALDQIGAQVTKLQDAAKMCGMMEKMGTR